MTSPQPSDPIRTGGLHPARNGISYEPCADLQLKSSAISENVFVSVTEQEAMQEARWAVRTDEGPDTSHKQLASLQKFLEKKY
jgi:hypothetical protein